MNQKHFILSDRENKLRIKTYFTNPYNLWKRSTNENTNELLRRSFHKLFNAFV